jgi:hypothetical protein
MADRGVHPPDEYLDGVESPTVNDRTSSDSASVFADRRGARTANVACARGAPSRKQAALSTDGYVVQFPMVKELAMPVSDQLTRLAARASEAEDHAAAAKTKARADLERDVKAARDSAKAQADQLSKAADAHRGKLSAWWDSLLRSWNEHIAEIRNRVDEKRAEHDLNAAQKDAESAEEDAAFAVDFAYAAIEEAEYAVLDAALARMNADELATSNS